MKISIFEVLHSNRKGSGIHKNLPICRQKANQMLYWRLKLWRQELVSLRKRITKWLAFRNELTTQYLSKSKLYFWINTKPKSLWPKKRIKHKIGKVWSYKFEIVFVVWYHDIMLNHSSNKELKLLGWEKFNQSGE